MTDNKMSKHKAAVSGELVNVGGREGPAFLVP